MSVEIVGAASQGGDAVETGRLDVVRHGLRIGDSGRLIPWAIYAAGTAQNTGQPGFVPQPAEKAKATQPKSRVTTWP